MPINSITGNTLLTSGSFPPARAATTGAGINLQTIGLGPIDGVALVAGDRVLVKDQNDPTTNGIYAAQTGPWVRTTDAAGNQNFFSGMAVTVALGAVNAGQTFICTCPDDPVVVGTSLITWAAPAAIQTAAQSAASTTSLTVGTGAKTLTIAAGKAFQVNQEVLIYETSNTAVSMLGQVTAYAGTSLTVNVTNTAGAGTHADWTVVLFGSAAAAGITPPIGTGNVTGPGSSTAGHVATFADGTGKVLSDGGVQVGGANTITPAMLASAVVGFAAGMLNGTLTASVAANALTVAVKTLAGGDPSPSDPVFFLITNAAGGYAVIEQTAALSLTVPAGATLGTLNGQAGRQWIGVFNNGGAAVLGIYNTLNASVAGAPAILAWDETSAANGTGITGSSTAAQNWYAASTLAAKNFRVIGYVESTQATAGQWAAAVTAKLFGPGVKRPGETVQEATTALAGGSTASATFVVLSGTSFSITPQSAANVMVPSALGPLQASSANGTAAIQLSRGTVNNTNLIGSQAATNNGASSGIATAVVTAYDLPNTVSSVTYAVQGKLSLGASASFGTTGTAISAIKELQV